jgi:hypothetical protein
VITWTIARAVVGISYFLVVLPVCEVVVVGVASFLVEEVTAVELKKKHTRWITVFHKMAFFVLLSRGAPLPRPMTQRVLIICYILGFTTFSRCTVRVIASVT